MRLSALQGTAANCRFLRLSLGTLLLSTPFAVADYRTQPSSEYYPAPTLWFSRSQLASKAVLSVSHFVSFASRFSAATAWLELLLPCASQRLRFYPTLFCNQPALSPSSNITLSASEFLLFFLVSVLRVGQRHLLTFSSWLLSGSSSSRYLAQVFSLASTALQDFSAFILFPCPFLPSAEFKALVPATSSWTDLRSCRAVHLELWWVTATFPILAAYAR